MVSTFVDIETTQEKTRQATNVPIFIGVQYGIVLYLSCQLSMPYIGPSFQISVPPLFPDLRFDAQGHALTFFALSSLIARTNFKQKISTFSDRLINEFSLASARHRHSDP